MPREREWSCLCAQPIRAGSLRRCPRCGAERPDTAALEAIAIETRVVLDALEEFDRLSGRFGRLQAMRAVLMQFGGRAGRGAR